MMSPEGSGVTVRRYCTALPSSSWDRQSRIRPMHQAGVSRRRISSRSMIFIALHFLSSSAARKAALYGIFSTAILSQFGPALYPREIKKPLSGRTEGGFFLNSQQERRSHPGQARQKHHLDGADAMGLEQQEGHHKKGRPSAS